MRARRTKTIAALCLALGASLALAGPVAAKVIHEQEGSFAVGLFSSLGVDSSSGPGAGTIWVGEPLPGGRAYQLDASGSPTGIEFDGSETPAGSFGFLSSAAPPQIADGVAVDGSEGANSGRIYIADLENGVVDLFNEAGEYVCQITGDATPSLSECAGATGSETPTGSLEPLSVAVNPANGDVAVGDAGGIVYLFDEGGAFEGEIEHAGIAEPGSLAFDSTGALYVVNSNGNYFDFPNDGDAVEFGPSGNFEGTVSGGARAAGVDTSSDHVYVGGNPGLTTTIREFDAAGSAVSSFGEGAASIDANATSSRVYAINEEEGQIWNSIFVPNVATGEATGIEEETATLHGEVDPEVPEGGSDIVSCEFEFGETEAYGQSAPCSPATPYSSATAVSASLSGLTPSTTYHFRVVAENEEGREEGGDRTFTTFGPPRISGEQSIARTGSATVKAQINPFGYETTCEVEYVDDASFQAAGYEGAATVPCEQTLEGDFDQHQVSAHLSDLTIGTFYHYRFVAHNENEGKGGTTVGEDQEFSTFGIESFSLELLDEEGNPYVNEATGRPSIPAGGHPHEMKVRFELTTTNGLGKNPRSATANMRNVKVQLPPGLSGNPTAAQACPPYQVKPLLCPAVTQVGTATVDSVRGGTEIGQIYNVVPPRGIAAQLSGRFNSLGIARIDAGVRSGSDYGVNADTLSVTAVDAVTTVEVRVWGVPGDDSHDGERKCASGVVSCSGGAPIPFLTNPTACTGPLTAGLSVDSWQDPGNFVSATDEMPAVEGCEGLHFGPTISLRPDTRAAESPTGLDVDLHLPQNQDHLGRATAHLKDATVKLPAGVAVNPSGANGLDACSVAQIGYRRGTSDPAEFTPDPARCPDPSKIGDVEVDTPLLDHPLRGAVYVAEPHDNPFDSLLAIYIAVHDPLSGVVVKLAGEVAAGPVTGQLTTTFSDNPQLPFEDFELDFFGGPRAALATPETCGAYTTTTQMTPWSENGDAHPSDSFAIGSGPNGSPCADSPAEQTHSPSFAAGTITPIAGRESPFVLNLRRADGTQRLRGLDVTLPPGLIGKLAGIPYCPEPAIALARSREGEFGAGATELAAPSCPAASGIGTVDVGAGAGSSPLHVQGTAYLAGPYKGAPLSITIVTPAVAGPYDLGTVVVRSALYVDPRTAQIRAVSDPIPDVLEVDGDGFPLKVRSISVQMSRPGFTRNPTSCAEMGIVGSAISVLNRPAPLFNRFQVGECRALGFKPRLRLRLKGATRRAKNPKLIAVLRARPGEANIARAAVKLPRSAFLDQGHIDTVCTRAQFAADRCPPRSVYGRANARSPLLDYSLRGKVYLRSSDNQLPDLVADLRGPAHQPIRIELVGRTDAVKGALRNTFDTVPDAPVSRFRLELSGGKRGLVINSRNLCRGKQRANVKMRGQNGKRHNFQPVVRNDCGKAKKRGTRASLRHLREAR